MKLQNKKNELRFSVLFVHLGPEPFKRSHSQLKSFDFCKMFILILEHEKLFPKLSDDVISLFPHILVPALTNIIIELLLRKAGRGQREL